MKKRVLLVSPEYMGLYKDILLGIEASGFETTFIAQEYIPNNPYNIIYGGANKGDINSFQIVLKDYWQKKLEDLGLTKEWFDVLLVIDGLTFHPVLIETLRRVNPHLYAVNYLYDRVKGVYQIDHNFKYFDKVFSFDMSDTSEYHLAFLPIYWVPCNSSQKKSAIFGFGAYDYSRRIIFERLIEIATIIDYDYYIKLYHPPINNKFTYALRRCAKKLLKGKENISLRDLRSDLFTNQSMSTDEFRQWISGSKVVIDTNHPYQDGLTARFMWALGANKKVITNNKSVKNYRFYSKEQVFVIDHYTTNQQIIDFITKEYSVPSQIQQEIERFRIDNWLDTMFNSVKC